MKRILLIGKMNDITHNIHTCLANEYHTQLCVDNAENVKKIVSISSPDLIVISLVGLNESHLDIFKVLERQCGNVPLIVIGTVNEYRIFSDVIDLDDVHYLERPVGTKRILEECRVCLQLGNEEFGGSGKKLIMMVDDSALSLRSMKYILEPKYDTVLVTNGSQAISQIDKHKPDLIILDYEMPVCNGERIFKLLKANENTKNIPVIFLTGVSDKDNIYAVLRLNPAGYFLKPPEASKLLKKIEEILG